MDALQVSGVVPVAMDTTEQTTVKAPLNPLAREFVPAVGGGATAALNPLAPEFVPVSGATLNPLAMEFVPWWRVGGGGLWADEPEFVMASPELYCQAPTVVMYPAAGAYDLSNAIPPPMTRRRRVSNNYSQHGRDRFSYRVRRINNEEIVRKTIYVTNIEQTVTEEMLAELFGTYGIVFDCRLCGDPVSGFRFAFIEFQYQEDAFHALNLNGGFIRGLPLKVQPSRTAIMPIKHSFLPRSEEEKERSSRTIYCTNIQKTVTPAELKQFFQYFGPVSRVRLMGRDNHATQIAFIEFTEANGAIFAVNSVGLCAKGLPMRVSPSKTPIRA